MEMNKELELEAEKYSDYSNNNIPLSFGDTYNESYKKTFIAGATSNWVEKQKLQFAIDQLNEIKSKMSFFEISNMENTLDNLYYKIQELEQKLSEL